MTANSDHICLEASFCSTLVPEIAAVAAAVMAAAAAPIFTLPAAFIAPATFANAAIPPTSRALKATVGFMSIFYYLNLREKTTLQFSFPVICRERERERESAVGSIYNRG
eukprot:TRINITY_DN9052_c0_g1_i1.p2 TRINITY_DN9052_c0_g1~~TRINITY_DN9052_c0_g1_i1.p2  ORF type:complete len:110 (+),score=26.77 TRINITY_DN9052_c0_g1_i1:469-798(+)